jgi:cytoskeletal protein CcmA (bactofilin family)
MPRPPVQDVNVTLTRPAPPPPAVPPTMTPSSNPSTEQIETVIGRESAVQGTIRSEHSIRIQGGAQGEIECKRSVFVEEGARVSAKITASEVTISGELDGQVFSSGRVEIKPTGRVSGEINAPSLIMLEGAFFDGQLRMKNRGQPEDATVPGRDETPVPPAGRRGSSGPPGAAAARNAFEN